MKKIIFVIESMNIGGTEKALLSMISEIPTDKYDITILLLKNSGGFLEFIPKHIKIKHLKEYDDVEFYMNKSAKEILLSEIKSKQYFSGIKTLFYYGISRISRDYNFYFNNKIMKRVNELNEEYDIAISYQGPPAHFSAYFVTSKIKAKKKIQWVHSDVSKLNLDIKTINNLYKNFDKIFVVSNQAKNKFEELFPKLKGITEVFNNIISSKLATHQSELKSGFNDNFDGIRILTVGRLSKEKGQEITIPILSRLREEGYNLKWYCVGEGILRDTYEKLIKEYNLEDYYILLGNDANPYPYFKECDIYVQPSKFEGYCIALAEARMFNKPIVSTDFSGAREQLINNETGFIVQFNDKEMYDAIKKIIDDKNIRDKFSANLRKQKLNTTNEINKLYDFIDYM